MNKCRPKNIEQLCAKLKYYDGEIKGGVYKLKYKWENPFERVGRWFFKIPSNTFNFYIEYNSQYTIKASQCFNLKKILVL